MEITKQQVIDKILSFNYAELADWINSRLHGNDKYFPVYLGHEPNLSEFLIDTFHHIKTEKFRDNFLEILGDLTEKLLKLHRNQIEESKEYISELLLLCGNIKQFENKDTLLEIAVSGKFKGIEMEEDADLHAELLTTLASYKITGIPEFWVDQLHGSSDKYKCYANPAFYALKDNLNILFEHIHIFIDNYKDDIQLLLGIETLIEDYGYKEVTGKFKTIERKLSHQQKSAVNEAFKDAGYEAIYKLDQAEERKLKYTSSTPRLQYIRETTPKYGTAKPVKTKKPGKKKKE